MAEQFYTILTKIGKAKVANATALGTKVNFCKMQVGDSNGSYYNPTEDQTELRHKVWEGNINNIRVEEENPNWIFIETMLPSNVGGFMIREAAILDDESNIVAVAKYPETYKPQTQDGSSKEILIRTILEVSNTQTVTLKLDPTTMLATKRDIQILEQKIENIKVPVTSVNSKEGAIELKAEDINCNDGKSVESHLEENKKQIDEKLPQLDFDNFRKDYVVNNGFAKTTGMSTIYNVILNPAPTNYTDGFNITMIPHIDCGDNPTLNVNGLGVSTILKQDGSEIKAGDIKANKPVSLVRVGSNFFMKTSISKILIFDSSKSYVLETNIKELFRIDLSRKEIVMTEGEIIWDDFSGGKYCSIYINGNEILSFDYYRPTGLNVYIIKAYKIQNNWNIIVNFIYGSSHVSAVKKIETNDDLLIISAKVNATTEKTLNSNMKFYIK